METLRLKGLKIAKTQLIKYLAVMNNTDIGIIVMGIIAILGGAIGTGLLWYFLVEKTGKGE